MQQPIVGYHRDAENHWVAELACGHFQHVRHDPPWTERPWVTTADGRRSKLGFELNCKKCDRGEPQDRIVPGERAGGQTGSRSMSSAGSVSLTLADDLPRLGIAAFSGTGMASLLERLLPRLRRPRPTLSIS